MGGRGTIGKITSISSSSLEIAKPDGAKVTVKLSADTEFRKDRQPAKLQDFKSAISLWCEGRRMRTIA